ncbi:hypothetical protein PM082_000454 [Marasmius tenuissimus]|nr:hypothetical protein PM082_000454 [Marasmius tenuissimus]
MRYALFTFPCSTRLRTRRVDNFFFFFIAPLDSEIQQKPWSCAHLRSDHLSQA